MALATHVLYLVRISGNHEKDKEIDEMDLGAEAGCEGGDVGGDGGGGGGKGGGEGSEEKKAPPAVKTEDFEDAGVPLIYLCATCWHETEGEMLSLLKSLFRYIGYVNLYYA